jgi:hypothetical protein
MSPTEYKAALQHIGLTQAGFAVWLRHHPATGKLWARKGAPPHIAKWLNLMMAKELTPNAIDRAIEGEKAEA